jgi:hypothetical protein
MTPSKAKPIADRPAKAAAVQETGADARLSAALRDNLKRRKAQQRAREQGAAGSAAQADTAAGDKGE